MPRKRLPYEAWQQKRREVWLRDQGKCQSPLEPPLCIGKPVIPLEECHIDHIKSGKLGSNKNENLRVLCPVCHALRIDKRHRGVTDKLLREGKLPLNWRDLMW